jgi:MoaA/NifB/PqqE/SkfB family radical SAM enzyme
MMKTSLDQAIVENPELRQRMEAGTDGEAMAEARRRLAGALCDLGLVHLASGRLVEGVKALQDGFNTCPSSQNAFHNLLHALLKSRQMRDSNFRSLLDFWNKNNEQMRWLMEYLPAILMPNFLNLEFVAGKCNLRCRMCPGGQSHGPESKLRWMSVEMFRKILEVAPTLEDFTLSSGDADPLMHPEIGEILEMAKKYRVGVDIYTNGQALDVGLCRKLVDSQVLRMINISLDAATAGTYRRIRGGDFQRVVSRVEILGKMQRDAGGMRDGRGSWISVSFVAMADNVEELPAFVELAGRLGAARVFVEDLMGWPADDKENRSAREHPRWREIMAEAARKAGELQIGFLAPKTLMTEAAGASGNGTEAVAEGAGGEKVLSQCSWVYGLWVTMDGTFRPCCMLGNDVADMGGVADGKLYNNQKFVAVKRLLAEGRVFKECCSQGNCAYVQQQLRKGVPLRIIGKEDLAAAVRQG